MTDFVSTSRQPNSDAPRGRIREALEWAIRDRGLRRFAILDTVGEGRFYPNGMEERSGDVMDEAGRVWLFWTGWDPIRERIVIQDWEEADVVLALKQTKGYARARRELGLGADDTAP